jgi:hypothetical protein
MSVTNTMILRQQGLSVLTEHLGILEAEHFVSIIKREPFDYTKWREDLFKDVPLDEFLKSAAEFREAQKKKQ